MTRRIGITNQKGGVAKTTDTINVAGALAAQGESVLAIDMDPQGYLTHRLGYEDAYASDPPSLYDALESPNEYDVADLVVHHEEFDLLPANIDMFRLEQDLIASGMRPRMRLPLLLEGVDEWDVILIDAPPSLGPLNDNVVLATEELLVPVEADDSSQLALNHLLRQLDTLEDNYSTTIDIAGVIVSNVSYPLDNEQEAAIEWYDERFEGHVPVWVVRTRAAIKRAMKEGGSVFADNAEEVDMTDVFAEIATEVADG
ncbi:SojD protein [Halorhabdus tiamatea SARL4B]|uniref:ParA family partitioning protein n=1 Tax=Halorhabdus tiamatea SARL4B TaxID=1033806 RepID=F7PHE2_9EURY|nr:ParA family protein [Halorhabdus tiamatea]ERJ04767.1 SojD protein [Halorhabdus tiamatea SARL4B]CCQ34953.1 parA family partitioning protein [Halorhabdus tiamatea SARL4B]